jgi:DNA-binding CsgD family transcriptional regulator
MRPRRATDRGDGRHGGDRASRAQARHDQAGEWQGDARAALEEFEAVGGGAGAVVMRAVLTAVLVERASLAEADAVAEELPPAEGPQHAMIGLHATRARLRQEQGRHAEALVELDAQLTVERRRGCVVSTREHVRAMRVETLAALGRTEEATRLADEEVALARRRGVAGAEARARLARSHVLPARAARAELERAVALARRSPSPLLRARCLASLGSVLLRAGAGAEAREPLGEARDLAHRCGATGLEGRVHEELLDAGARPRRVARSGPAALTASERRVAELAAQEIPNREIAERLCVTPKTVEVHLGRVYGKLGIKGRTQLAGALTGAC